MKPHSPLLFTGLLAQLTRGSGPGKSDYLYKQNMRGI
jgi:hypothetical protein